LGRSPRGRRRARGGPDLETAGEAALRRAIVTTNVRAASLGAAMLTFRVRAKIPSTNVPRSGHPEAAS